MTTRKTIGVVIDTMDGGFQKEIVANIRRSAKEKNYNVLFASGFALLQGRNRDSQYNTIFRLLASNRIDGIILVLSSLEVFYDQDAVKLMLEDYKDIPLVSISLDIEGAYSICIDNQHASEEIVEHCVNVHNYRKIAYISGPLKNTEAIARYDGFKAIMKKYQIDDFMFYEGDFMQGSGYEAAKIFTSDVYNYPEIIIAANDVMASGAFMRLAETGIRIPNQIALCGFDNIEIASAFFPAFTTINQPIDKMTDIAFSNFEKIFQAIDVMPITYVYGDLVIRESCGCMNNISDEPMIKLQKVKNNKKQRSYAAGVFEELLMKSKLIIIPRLLSSLGLPKSMNQYVNDGFNKLFDSLAEDAYSEDYGRRFLDQYYIFMSEIITITQVRGSWTDFINIFREYVIRLMDNDEIRVFLEETFFKASLITGNQMVRKKTNEYFVFQEMYLTSRTSMQRLSEIQSFDVFYDEIQNIFPEFGITQCYICLYDKPILNDGTKDFELPKEITKGINYYNGIKRIDEHFETKDILPDAYMNQLDRYDMTCLSLFNHEYQYGYMITSLNAIDLLLYESLRGQVSGAIRNIELLKRRRESDEILLETNQRLMFLSIRDELTGLLNRRGFYKQADAFMKKVKKDGISFSVLFCDLDKLKYINDIYGHREGDSALIKVAFQLQNVLRKKDIIARMSGDEFIIILKDVDDEDKVKAYIRKIKNSFIELNRDIKKPYKISMSIGYCTYNPEIHVDIDEMIGIADKLLYIDKER